MTNTVISYPIPLYQNLPIQSEFYIPNFFTITSIVLGINTTITTLEDMNYVIGQQVRLIIPRGYGSRELNERTAYVINILSPTQVVLDMNSLGASAFIPSPPGQNTAAQILAIGDVISGAINANGPMNMSTFIPGSFINISPL